MGSKSSTEPMVFPEAFKVNSRALLILIAYIYTSYILLKEVYMDAFIPGDPAHHGMCDDGASNKPDDGSSWYISRKEIEEDSPSKRDGIDLKRETYLRKSYCTFLQDLGMRLKVPQVTIATAIIFCHRFFLRHSHAKNDRRTIATVCMFLAGKVEETPRPLKDVILVSYEIIHKKDPAAVQRIKQKEVYEEQKELILVGERLVLATLAFDFNVHHPYKPLVEAIKKFKVAQNALAQVAWNFVNDGLRTSLCLQFKPHHIAAGAIFLAAKFLKVKLPSDGERVWWQEFDVTPRQLEEVSNQMLELYEQNRVPPAQGGSEMEGSAGGGTASHRGPSKTPTANEDHTSTAVKPTTSKPYADTHGGVSRTTKSGNDEYATEEVKSSMNKGPDGKILENQPNKGESQHTRSGLEEFGNERDKNVRKQEKIPNRDPDLKETIGQSPRDAIKRLDKDKVKAALAQTRKFRTGMTRKPDNMDEDDLIAREIEDGIELAVESDKIKKERRQNWSKQQSSNRHEDETSHQERREVEHIEEGEVSAIDNAGRSSPSPKSVHCKRKAENSPDQNRLGYPTY